MFTGARRSSAGSSGDQEGMGDKLDALSEELRRRPEVRILNKYAVSMAYIRIGVKNMGALALLWATVVLLGGFVSDLRRIDFWYLTIIAFIQAAGLSDALGDDRLMFFGHWVDSLMRNIISWGEKHHDKRKLPMRQWLKRQINILRLKIIDITLSMLFFPVECFAAYGPIICFVLSLLRLRKQDYGIADGEANMEPGLTLFYCLSLAQSAFSFLSMIIGAVAEEKLVEYVSQQYGFSPKVLGGYLDKTKQICLNNAASTVSWNLIAYGADLLDSQLPEDYVSGGRVLTMLIDQDTPLAITWLLNLSPIHRIQKLIGTLAWGSPAEQEMRCHAARIVEHLAGHLNLAHFPGALECISSLFDTSYHNNADQEALHSPFLTERSKQRKRRGFLNENFAGNPWEDKDGNKKDDGGKDGSFTMFTNIITAKNPRERHDAAAQYNKERSAAQQFNKERENYKGTDKDLVLLGLRILEKLAHNRHNCTLIYNTKDILSKIVAPVSSNKLEEDIKSNATWTKVIGGSLKVVSQLMGSSGSTSVKMRRLIANNSNAVTNLEAVLDMDMKSNSVIKLQIQAIDVLTQLALHHPANNSATKIRDKIIERALHIFLTTGWIEDYLKDEKMKLDNTLPTSSILTYMISVEKRAAEAHVEKRMKEAKETASRLKEKAGEALAMLSSDSEAVKSFTGCKNNEVVRLTELLNSKTSATDTTIPIEITIGCRISAAVILKHLSNYDKKPTLRMVLTELLPMQAELSSTTMPSCWERAIPCIKASRNKIGNPGNTVKDKPSNSQSHHIQQYEERRLQAELLSFVATIRANNNLDFATILMSLTPPATKEDFVVRLKNMVEDSMYATPACLAIQKLTCKMVIEFIQQHDENVEVIGRHDIVGALLEASEMMVVLESSMLFAGVDRDCHGVPLKPLSSVLAKNAEDLLAQKKQALGVNIAPATASAP
ncbi:uncharacterized protein [Aegilops tauschii subsp. strangulata]|uniref:Uncharacterized protein n=2 Tax=Aegilops tauschii TaxID=37682 RepID=A0A453DF75_AEGTS|nr:uncharacterized protein LOC123497423 [Aegilops tauschii subsp. strangulata]